ncbi:MAG: hypothetical protein ACYC4Q_08300 [Victivallaceae bacterium]
MPELERHVAHGVDYGYENHSISGYKCRDKNALEIKQILSMIEVLGVVKK